METFKMTDPSEILELLRETDKNYHPLTSLLALSKDEDASVTDKITCHKAIVKYILPELRSVESKIDLKAELGGIHITIDGDLAGSEEHGNPPPQKLDYEILEEPAI